MQKLEEMNLKREIGMAGVRFFSQITRIEEDFGVRSVERLHGK